MKKTTTATKDIAKTRLTRHEIMKIDLIDPIVIKCKENIYPKNTKLSYKSETKYRERNVKNFDTSNPFCAAATERMFIKCQKTRPVRPVPFIMTEPITVCDIDDTFYKIIEGRPLRQLDDIKVRMRNIRDITLFRANAAYLKDNILSIDTSFANELQEYKSINKLFESCKRNFVQFARDSYNKANMIQNKAKNKAIDLEIATDKLEELSFNFVTINNKLDVLLVFFQNLTKYRHFLNLMSPDSWIIANNQDFLEGDLILEGASETPIEYLKNSIEHLQKCNPLVFFQESGELMTVFERISDQCLSYMCIDVVTSNMLKSVSEIKNHFKASLAENINEMEYVIDIYKKYIIFEENNEKELKVKFNRILINEFQALYASYEATKLFTCVQYTNTQIFQGPEDPKDSLSSLVLQLERQYLELTSALDSLDTKTVHEATKQLFAEDIEMMQNAHKAQRTLRECDILKKSLCTSFEPPRRRKQK